MSSFLRLPALLLATVSVAVFASPATPPELRGILTTGHDHRFILVASGGSRTAWVGLGQRFDEWKVVDFIPTDDAIVLTREDQRVTVKLRPGSTGTGAAALATPATIAEADAVLTKMRFEAMWDQIVAEQRKGIAGSIRQQAAAEFAKHGLGKDEIDGLIDRMSEATLAGMDSELMRQDFARIFSEVYTKEELRGMADFYDTAAGKAWAAKQPEVQQKLMQAMMPRVMQGMPAAQKIAFDYLRERASRTTTPSSAAAQPGGSPHPR